MSSKEEDSKKQQDKKEEVAVIAPKEEWREIERLITSYRQQSKAMKRFTATLEKLTRFQRRLTEATGWKPPDDYFI